MVEFQSLKELYQGLEDWVLSSEQILNSWYGNPKSSFAVFVLVTRKSAFISSILASFFLNFTSYFD